jgi:hypothetical protein
MQLILVQYQALALRFIVEVCVTHMVAQSRNLPTTTTTVSADCRFHAPSLLSAQLRLEEHGAAFSALQVRRCAAMGAVLCCAALCCNLLVN